MTGTSQHLNAGAVRSECAAGPANSLSTPRCSHRERDGLVDLGERASRRCGRKGRFRGDHNGGQEFSLSCQYQRAQSRGHCSFYQSLAGASAWCTLYPAGIARCATGIVSGGSGGPISPPPIRSSPKPIKIRCARVDAPRFVGEPPPSVLQPSCQNNAC